MSKKVIIRSRIHQYLNKEILEALNRICRTRRTTDNNKKVEMIKLILDKYEIDYVELGAGTNRYAVLIDNYVFKIALDKWGLQDNLNEFTVSKELVMFASKTYETNELIAVAEYVTVISKEEFIANKDNIRTILESISDSFLLGDVGTVMKNFTNWGYRDDGSLVILDYAYVYRVLGTELICSNAECGSLLDYDENYDYLKCPVCRKKYSFIDIRRKLGKDVETHENRIAKSESYKLETYRKEYTLAGSEPVQKEDTNMGRKSRYYDYDEECMEEEIPLPTYEEMLNRLRGDSQEFKDNNNNNEESDTEYSSNKYAGMINMDILRDNIYENSEEEDEVVLDDEEIKRIKASDKALYEKLGINPRLLHISDDGEDTYSEIYGSEDIELDENIIPILDKDVKVEEIVSEIKEPEGNITVETVSIITETPDVVETVHATIVTEEVNDNDGILLSEEVYAKFNRNSISTNSDVVEDGEVNSLENNEALLALRSELEL